MSESTPVGNRLFSVDRVLLLLLLFVPATLIGVMALVSLDGESHWMEGVQLLAVYVMLGLAFFFLPV